MKNKQRMSFEYLLDYQLRERKNFGHYSKSTSQENLFKTIYPPKERFNKLHERYSYSVALSSKLNISFWPQVPITGSLIIPLDPIKSQIEFEKLYKFSISEIPDIIKYSKETGKIQFVLNQPATQYCGIEYLAPIFEKLNPPLLFSIHDTIDAHEYKIKLERADNELTDLYRLGLIDYLLPFYSNPNKSKEQRLIDRNTLEISLEFGYPGLKLLGYDDITDIIYDNFFVNPALSLLLLKWSYEVLCRPVTNPLHFSPNFSQFEFNMIQSIFKDTKLMDKRKFYFPYEIGSFILKKHTYSPKNFQECIEVIDHYKDEDLYSVSDALNRAILANMGDKVLQNRIELSTIMDNIWDEAKLIRNRANQISIGTGILIGAIGLLIDNLTKEKEDGLLYNLGYKIFEISSPLYINKFSEFISKGIANPYAVTIFDFDTNYNSQRSNPRKN
ncbi:MAG: hypothetical protein A4E35_01293 [Methanoregula sp. PtaU1.Bin051]|nr:MAG: hypothetical protein A4E35_01293 [Methanoregula sp. PtaU1.Bin051]